MSAKNNGVNFPRVGDVSQGVGVEQDQVGKLSGCNRSQFVFPAEETRGIECRGLQRLHGRQSRLHQQPQLIVQTEAGKTIRIACIGARQNSHASALHRANHVNVLLKFRSSGWGERTGELKIETDHRLAKFERHILQPGVVRAGVFAGDVNPQHGQRGTLPGVVGPEFGEHGIRFRPSRTGLQNAGQMFNASLPGIGRFFHRDRVGNVPFKRDAALFGFIRYGKIGRARQQRIDFDKIRAVLNGLRDRAPAFDVIAGGQRAGPDRFWPVDNGAGDEHARPDQFTLLDLLAPLMVLREAPHNPNAGDAIGNEQRQIFASIQGMNMHVPQPGNQELSGGIHDYGVGRRLNLRALSQRNDALSLHDHRNILARRRTGHVNHRGMGQSQEILIRGGSLSPQETRQEDRDQIN